MQPRFDRWQEPGSPTVNALGKDSDVFAFAYGQNVEVTEIAEAPALRDGIQRLRAARYSDIVLVGHSAGGLIARQFVEDHPDAGVTKVIQVCAPNGGASAADLYPLARDVQKRFVQSLTKEARGEFLKSRPDKRIPATVQFVCVVGDVVDETVADLFDLDRKGDLVVNVESQWPMDLQEQGVPAVAIRAGHWGIRGSGVAEPLAELIRQDCQRCSAETVASQRKKIFGRRQEP